MASDFLIQSNNNVNFNPPPLSSRDVAAKGESPFQAESHSLPDKRTPILHQKLLTHSNLRGAKEPETSYQEKIISIRRQLLQFYHSNSKKIPHELENAMLQLDLEILKKNNDASILSKSEVFLSRLKEFLQKNPSLNTQGSELLKNLQKWTHSFNPTNKPKIESTAVRAPIPSEKPAGSPSLTNSQRPLSTLSAIDRQLLDFFYAENGDVRTKWKGPLKFYVERFKKSLENNDGSLPHVRELVREHFKHTLDANLFKFYDENKNHAEIDKEEFIAPIRNYSDASNENTSREIKLLIDHLKASSFKDPSIAQKVQELKTDFEFIASTFYPAHDLSEEPPTPASLAQNLNAFSWDNRKKFTPKLQNDIGSIIRALNKNYPSNEPLHTPRRRVRRETNSDQIYRLGKIFIAELERFLLKNPDLRARANLLIGQLNVLLHAISPSRDTEDFTRTQISFEKKLSEEESTQNNPPDKPKTPLKVDISRFNENSRANLNALKSFEQRKGEFKNIASRFHNKIETAGKIADSVQRENAIQQAGKDYRTELYQAIALPPGYRADITLNYRDPNDPSGIKPYNHDDDSNGIEHSFSYFIEEFKIPKDFPLDIQQAFDEIKRDCDLGMAETRKINRFPEILERVLKNAKKLHAFLQKSQPESTAFEHLDSALQGLLDKDNYAREVPEQRRRRGEPPSSDRAAFERSRTLIPKTDRPFTLHVSSNSLPSPVVGTFGYRGDGPVINIFRPVVSDAGFDSSSPESHLRYGVFLHEMGHLLASFNPEIRDLATKYILKHCEKNPDGSPKITGMYVKGPWSKGAWAESYGNYIGRLGKKPDGSYEAPEVLSEGFKAMLLDPVHLYENCPELFALVYDASRNLPGSIKQAA